ncbi:MAG: hypothetical protein QXP36_13690, partial [Conexivisphaerales archaeon]
DGSSVGILNGLDVRGLKKIKGKKDNQRYNNSKSIAMYHMVSRDKETFVIPENFRNLREIITVYSIVIDKVRTAKNNPIGVMDMISPCLSNTLRSIVTHWKCLAHMSHRVISSQLIRKTLRHIKGANRKNKKDCS